jgi:protein O-mannosyl-transferase
MRHDISTLFTAFSPKNTSAHIVLITLVVCLVYSNTLNAPFAFDDIADILKNARLRDIGNFWPPDSSTRWLGSATFALNYHIGALDTTGYHLFNILIHVINAILVYFFVTVTLTTPWFQRGNGRLDATADGETGRYFIPFFTALFFAAHPVQTQAVTYIVQRFASLATMFYLFSIVSYAQARFALQKRQTVAMTAWYLSALLSAVLAMKTKEIAFTLPIVIMVYEFVFFRTPFRRRIPFLIPMFLALLIIPVSLVGIDTRFPDMVKIADTATRIESELSRADYLLTQFRVVATYLRLLLVPVDQNLDYDYPVFHSLMSDGVFPALLLHLSLIGAGCYLLFQSYRDADLADNAKSYAEATLPRLIAFGIFWFYVTLSVESSIIPIRDVIFEHRLYLPSVGFFIAAVSIIELVKIHLKLRFPGAAKTIIIAATIAALSSAVAAYVRNDLWTDVVRLWSDTVRKSPQKARPHVNLGQAYFDIGHIDDAIAENQAALQIDPGFLEAHYNLGNSYMAKGYREPAMIEYESVLSRDTKNPRYSLAHYLLGQYYFEQRRYSDAAFHFATLVMINPYSADVHNELGKVYIQLGNLTAARIEFKTALKLAPGFMQARNNLQNIAK